MAIGNPITLTSNVASKTLNVIATASQSSFTVNGGYRINEIAVFRNGVRLVDGRDFTARDGATVTLLSAATEGDALEFQVFDTFRVADAITPFDSDQTIAGNLNITGILSASQLGSVNFNVTSGIQTFNDVRVGGALTVAGVLTYDDVTNVDSVGIITAQSGVSIADSIFHTGDTNTAIRFPAADTFTVETGGSEALRVDSSQNTTFGTTSESSTSVNITASTSGSCLLSFNDTNSGQGGIRYFHSTDHMQFHTADAEKVRITSAGLVGIGTNSPSSLFEVAGATPQIRSTDTDGPNDYSVFQNSSGNSVYNAVDNNAAGGHIFQANGSEKLRIDSSGRLLLGTTTEGDANADDLTVATSGHTGITIRSGTTNRGNIYFSDGTSGDAEYRGIIEYNHDGDTLKLGTANSVRATIDSSGRLLISTTSSTSNIAGYGNGGIQLNSTTTAQACVNIIHRNNSDNTHAIVLAKARDGAANGGRVQDDDDFGAISFQGFDGTGGSTYRQGAEIRGAVDGTPGNADMPGRLEFLTTPDGSATPTERLRIDATGRVLIGSGAISSPKANTGGLDIATHNVAIVFGGSSLSGTTPLRADNATKDGRIAAAHYTNSEEPVGVVRVISSSTENQVHWGGGSSIINAATDHRFYTASTPTTTGGTERFRILAGGQVNVAGNFTQTTYTMQVTGTFNATSNITQNGNALATNGKAIAMALIFG